MAEHWKAIDDWMEQNPSLVIWLMVVSVVLFIITVAVAVTFVVRIPSDYFVRDHEDSQTIEWKRKHPVGAVAWVVLRNIVGVVLIIAGIIMLVAPGQGIATLLIGVVLVDIPGKHRFQRWLLRRRSVQRSINWLRRKFNREPLEMPEKADPS